MESESHEVNLSATDPDESAVLKLDLLHNFRNAQKLALALTERLEATQKVFVEIDQLINTAIIHEQHLHRAKKLNKAAIYHNMKKSLYGFIPFIGPYLMLASSHKGQNAQIQELLNKEK